MGESWLDQQLDSFRPAVPIEEEWLHEDLAASEAVQQEDADICESVQGGLESSSYDKGRHSTRREADEHHFHRLLAADVAMCRRR
jgi:hypothetical protein